MPGPTFQVHANVNADHGDSSLRVTITFYDENGYEVQTQTWRRHVKTLQMDGSAWQAWAAVVDLEHMMAGVCESPSRRLDPDEALPGL